MTGSTSTHEELHRIQKRSMTVMAILAVIAFAFAASAAYPSAIITAGFEEHPDLADGGDVTSVALPVGKSAEDLIDFGVDRTDTGYFWWSDGTVSQGTGRGAADIAGTQPFDVPFGKRVSDIAGMAIDRTGNVYTYYRDYTVSIGDPFNLDSIDRPRPYILPVGYKPADIIGVGMLQRDVVLFFNDGTHHYTDIDDYRNFTITAPDYERGRYTIPSGFGTASVAGMDFADSDRRLYTMFVTDSPARFTGTQPPQTAPTNAYASNNDGITIAKDGWTLTLPSGR